VAQPSSSQAPIRAYAEPPKRARLRPAGPNRCGPSGLSTGNRSFIYRPIGIGKVEGRDDPGPLEADDQRSVWHSAPTPRDCQAGCHVTAPSPRDYFTEASSANQDP